MREPLIGMLSLIGVMFIIAFLCRMFSVHAGNVKLSHYEVFSGGGQPDHVTKTTNNLNNLFQLPPIFIAACVLCLAKDLTSPSLIFNAWGFVAVRYLHTLVHITLNKVIIRSLVFGAGLYFLAAIWVEILSSI